MGGGVSEGRQLYPHDTERRQSPGQLYAWSRLLFQPGRIYIIYYIYIHIYYMDAYMCIQLQSFDIFYEKIYTMFDKFSHID